MERNAGLLKAILSRSHGASFPDLLNMNPQNQPQCCSPCQLALGHTFSSATDRHCGSYVHHHHRCVILSRLWAQGASQLCSTGSHSMHRKLISQLVTLISYSLVCRLISQLVTLPSCRLVCRQCLALPYPTPGRGFWAQITFTRDYFCKGQ